MLELGVGMGLCGLALAVQDSDSLVTDLAPVIAHLRNCVANFSPSAVEGTSQAVSDRNEETMELGPSVRSICKRLSSALLMLSMSMDFVGQHSVIKH